MKSPSTLDWTRVVWDRRVYIEKVHLAFFYLSKCLIVCVASNIYKL